MFQWMGGSRRKVSAVSSQKNAFSGLRYFVLVITERVCSREGYSSPGLFHTISSDPIKLVFRYVPDESDRGVGKDEKGNGYNLKTRTKIGNKTIQDRTQLRIPSN